MQWSEFFRLQDLFTAALPKVSPTLAIQPRSLRFASFDFKAVLSSLVLSRRPMPEVATLKPPPFPEKSFVAIPLAITIAASIFLVSFAARLSTPHSLAFCAVYSTVSSWLMFRMSAFVRKSILPRLPFELDPPWRRSAVMLTITPLFAVILYWIDRYFLKDFYLRNNWLTPETIERFLDASLLVRTCAVLGLHGFFSAQLSFQRMAQSLVAQAEALRAAEEARQKLDAAELLRQQAEMEARIATQLATEAELTALKMQINPHFLFNTLGSIAVLARLDGPRASAMTEKLADIFRYALQSSKRRGATLGEECDFLNAYFEIEKARFNTRLEMTVEIAPELRNLPVPNLLLQPMVENAVVHAFRGMCKGWRIAVRAVVAGDFAEISVADNGRGFEGADPLLSIGRGTALKNIDERLRRFYGQDTHLIVTENSPQGALFKIRVPYPTSAIL
jgi:sensor histidine kinase YesM